MQQNELKEPCKYWLAKKSYHVLCYILIIKLDKRVTIYEVPPISILNPSENPPTSSSCNALLEEVYIATEEEEVNVDIDVTDVDKEKIDQELNIVFEDYIFM